MPVFASTCITCIEESKKLAAVKDGKTYNRRDSQMVTHSSTNLHPRIAKFPAERSGNPIVSLTDLRGVR
jgi:hypothetical protein